MHWYYLKRCTNFRRQLSKRHVTPKINFCNNKEFTQNPPETALVWFFVISLTSSGQSNKVYRHCSTQKHIFHFLNVNFTLLAFYELLKAMPLYQPFSLCMMFAMHFDNVSVLLNSVATTYVHLETSSITITCWYGYTAKLEIHTRLK